MKYDSHRQKWITWTVDTGHSYTHSPQFFCGQNNELKNNEKEKQQS